jgi:uncharacterized protein
MKSLRTVAVAVSGGVDSMTLAHVAAAELGPDVEMFHAVSPAVTPEATARVRRHAMSHGWRLVVLDAGEFDDERYLANPRDRCLHCKRHLYDAIRARTGASIVSGTNADDLAEYRPGLRAAADAGVGHPLVEAGIHKAGVRAIARYLGLSDVAELPAAPCLSSRIETGVRIAPSHLDLVHRVETHLARMASEAVRCRIRADGVVIELDVGSLDRLSVSERAEVCEAVGHLTRAEGMETVRIEPYRNGSAFVEVRGG